jgi:protein SCO1
MVERRGAVLNRLIGIGAVLGVLAGSVLIPAGRAGASINPPPADVGATSNRRVPASISELPLTNQDGQTLTLASWPKETVVLVPFLTLCSDICPMTTGNLLQTHHALRIDGAAKDVQIVELSVDPDRDTPFRLAAYAKLTGANWELVTEAPAELATIATFFGFFYQKVPEDNPPDIDWLTGQPLTYDIDHSDGFVIINPKGIERYVTGGAPDFHGTLDPTLRKFLSPLGDQHLRHPPNPSWTPADLLQALSWSMQRPLTYPGP